MKGKKVEIDDVFERLTVEDIKLEPYCNQNKTYAYCRCSCGKDKLVRCLATSLIQGKQKSCGCWKADKAKESCKARTKHNLTDHLLYGIWAAIKTRCYNSKAKFYKNYGGRGISMCDEWRKDFQTFYNWCINNGYQKGLSLDRIDNDGNYCPENCRWLTQQEQCWNRSNNLKVDITAFGETKDLYEWIQDDRCLIQNANTIVYRLGAGWDEEKAMTKPSERKRRSKINKTYLYRFVKSKHPDILKEFIKDQGIEGEIQDNNQT